MKFLYKNIKFLFPLIILLALSVRTYSQEQPPKPIKVTTFQNLSFGAFFQGISGGTVVIYPDGTRTLAGSIIGANLGFLFFPAIFEVEAEPGVIINITKGPDVVLTGSNSGTLILKIGDTDPASPFINAQLPPGRTQVRVGGRLTVGNPLASPQGSYNGIFSVTFNQE